MSTDSYHRVEETEQTNYFKKLAVPFAVVGISGAAVLLFAGGKSTSPASTELIQQSFLNEDTELFAGESCTTNFDRIWNGDQSDFIGSQNMTSHLVNDKYEDPSFPADDSSLFWDMQNGSSAGPQVAIYKGLTKDYQGIIWKRPTDLINNTMNPGANKPSLFGPKGIQVRTSEQGDLGDCWFLSSATAVAEYPERMHEVFGNTQEYNQNGAFQMYFYVRGVKVAVHIDDRIPFVNYGPGYTFTYDQMGNDVSQDGAWWLVLLEKAFAKLNVNYANINLGRPGEALRALTGAPVINYIHDKFTSDKLWDIVTDGMNNKYEMVAGTPQNPAFGVTGGHAETCLGSLILRNSDGSEHVKLIKMRNPWGRYQYDGPWSRKSDLWTPEFKKQADFAEADDGIFYTPLDDWKSEYENLAIAHTRTWQVSSIDGVHKTFEKSTQQIEWTTFTNPIEQDVLIECDQYTQRLWPQATDNVCHDQENFPQIFSAYVFEEGESNWQTVMTTYPASISCDGEAFMMNKLAPGQYNIAVYNFNGSDKGHGIWTMRTYAQNAIVDLRHRPEFNIDHQES